VSMWGSVGRAMAFARHACGTPRALTQAAARGAAQKLLVGAVEHHRRDLLRPLLGLFDRQVRGMGTGVPAGFKPEWALDEGTAMRALDAAAAAGDAPAAQLAWAHLELAVLPQGARAPARAPGAPLGREAVVSCGLAAPAQAFAGQQVCALFEVRAKAVRGNPCTWAVPHASCAAGSASAQARCTATHAARADLRLGRQRTLGGRRPRPRSPAAPRPAGSRRPPRRPPRSARPRRRVARQQAVGLQQQPVVGSGAPRAAVEADHLPRSALRFPQLPPHPPHTAHGTALTPRGASVPSRAFRHSQCGRVITVSTGTGADAG